ncbi:hypothetical protein AW736_23445 [Termitidicoccus mucosus]|uniref:Sialate O-acetylesterase domain-containing protein n=1 Tax=Termitidicoccus mucosus TaxID=1184151 RepID=A0A178IBH1_9BACT|nr:hypothetical protein AW736_23445 [Opitutaceae bacterium TSB47]
MHPGKNIRSHLTLCSAAVLAFFASAATRADVEMPAVFGNRMVIQRGQPVRVWGRADAGEKIAVALAGHTAAATADASGTWSVALPPLQVLPPGAQPLRLEVAGKNKLAFHQILVGDVWLCSGQSNMFFQLRQSARAEADVAAATRPGIRLFSVDRAVADGPQFTCKGKWADCTPETAARFSAVAYFFGLQWQADNGGIPVGLIHSSWGGTTAEAWTPRAVLDADSDLKPILTRWDETMADFPKIKADFEANKERLVAEWKIAVQKAKAEGRMLPAEPRLRTGPGTQYQPAGLYHAMITPLAPFALSGVLWYQGEGNAQRAHQYRKLFPAMIRSWRDLWNRDDLPFLYVQLPNLARQPEPSRSGWAELREAQLRALALPHTAMAVTIDVGDPGDLHPKEKLPVGRRLASAAGSLFGLRPPADGICPYPRSHKIQGREIRVQFSPSTVALRTRDGGEPHGFTIAGTDKQFVPARARLEGNAIVIWSDTVEKPAAARYAWADNPDCNIVSAAGLPASPFRTDDWPEVTFGNR